MQAGPFVPEVSLTRPEALAELHREFVRAGAVVKRFRREVPFMERDRSLSPDLRKAEELVRTGEVVRSAGEAIGTLE